MPNQQNITRPILIVGAGRTASSYLLHILKLRGDVQTLVENELVMELHDLVMESWWSRNWVKECSDEELDRRLIQFSRQAMVTMFPGEEPNWAYKAIWESINWSLYQRVYPMARYIHLARDPRTNIASMMDFIGGDEGHSHWTLEYSSSKYVDSNWSALKLLDMDVPYLLVRQEDFIDAPLATWKRVFQFLELPEMELDFRKEINTSSSTTGRVRQKRATNSLAWSDLSDDILAVAPLLGYSPDDD